MHFFALSVITIIGVVVNAQTPTTRPPPNLPNSMYLDGDDGNFLLKWVKYWLNKITSALLIYKKWTAYQIKVSTKTTVWQ